MAGLRQHGNARLAQSLEGIGGRPGLEYPAPQQLRSGGLDSPGYPGHLHLGFHGAGSGDQAELRPDPGVAYLHHGVLRVGGTAGQAIGRRDAPHVQHIGQSRQTLRVQPPGVPHQGQHIGVLSRDPADPHPLIHQAHRQLPQRGFLGVFLDNNDHMILRAAVYSRILYRNARVFATGEFPGEYEECSIRNADNFYIYSLTIGNVYAMIDAGHQNRQNAMLSVENIFCSDGLHGSSHPTGHKRRYQMKRLPKMLCALILCALMVTAAVSCGQKPAQQPQDPPQQEDPQPAPELKIAVDSDPARSAVIHWFYSEEGQALFGDTDPDDVIFSVDPRDIAQELKLGNYDAAVCAPDQKALQLLGGYESMPLLKDAVIFVHGNIGQEDADYNLSSETLRSIYAGTAPLFWDEAQTQPLIPAYGYASDAQDPLWQLMSMQFGFTADAPDILTRGTWDNPVWATVETGRVGSPLFPLHYNWLFGEAGINGSVISVDGVRPTDATLADGSYPFTLSYYGLYWPSHPQARQIAAILQGVQAMQTAD